MRGTWRLVTRGVLLLTALSMGSGCAGRPGGVLYGTVASRPEHAAACHAAGLRAVTYEVYWDRLQPARDRFDEAQFEQARRDLAAFRAAGMEVVLSLGLQYPPAWAFEVPHSRYVNQYGEAYVGDEPGANGLNAVFNQEIRALQAAYVARALEVLGRDAYAVRLGWGTYGELSYPIHRHGDRVNVYWGFDEPALGRALGLAATLPPNPVPAWKPGEPSTDHASARQFAEWYLGAMTDYQNWQIATVRAHYDGRLAVLYPSWGVRPGQLEAAVARDLSGFTPAEQNGEIQRGHDFARHVGSLADRKIVVYTTWLDAAPAIVDDTGGDRAGWSPAHYLAQLAREHTLNLEVWGENTGWGAAEQMRLSFDRLQTFGLTGLFWAFEEQLLDPSGRWATLEDYQALIEALDEG
jgi:hypothetical protein